jgi:hypothetical protein
MITIDKINKIYTDAFNKYLNQNDHRGWSVTDGSGNAYPDTGVGKFYLCGFADVRFSCKGKNRELKKKLNSSGIETRSAYGGGLYFKIPAAKFHTNGKFEPMVEGYNAVSDYLNGLGYSTYVWDHLD